MPGVTALGKYASTTIDVAPGEKNALVAPLHPGATRRVSAVTEATCGDQTLQVSTSTSSSWMVDGAADESISVVITGPGSHASAPRPRSIVRRRTPEASECFDACIDDADSVGAR